MLVVESKKHLLVAVRCDYMENKPQELLFPAQSVHAVDAPPARNAGPASTWAGTLFIPLERSEVSSLRCYWMFQAGSQGQQEQIVLTCSEVSRELDLVTCVLFWACYLSLSVLGWGWVSKPKYWNFQVLLGSSNAVFGFEQLLCSAGLSKQEGARVGGVLCTSRWHRQQILGCKVCVTGKNLVHSSNSFSAILPK